MQSLFLLLLSTFALCSALMEGPGPSEGDVINNIVCSVYDLKNKLTQVNIPLHKKAKLRNPNIFSFDSAPKPAQKKPEKCEKCMDKLGCFHCKAFNLDGLPSPASEIRTNFRVFSREEEKGAKFTFEDINPVLDLINGPTQLIFIVHGFHSSGRHPWVMQLKDKLLQNEDVIVITVDWARGASATHTYMQTVRNSQVVGRQIALILHSLVKKSDGFLIPKKTHWIGHGLGAQMTIFFWEFYRVLSGNLVIGKITALDPAKAFFEDFNFHVNVSMARFVEVMHTSTGNINGLSFGIANPIGHVDFYMNGGSAPQPGCEDFNSKSPSCSHSRATSYYIEAIENHNNCSMISYACTGGLEQYEADKCEIDEDYWNAISLNETEGFPGRGIQFVDTHSASPFCKSIGKTDSD